ncbi:hypothetical protein OKW76_08865 [Sphingomonas sp. S1-29]|uniref:hypothetical protein n=1 Tax=Sphingomonas sp. S1-29 TaxID=2991074 RepID=UPI00223FE953|nr:hypothetical protein [Sphingomonas sp. S1-29]UZK68186.1 hypothetical protein OKW76_08865 [Sphingomonas sp. S1-29]
MRTLIAGLALTLCGCAATPEQLAADEAKSAAEFAEATKGLVAGEPQRCLSSIGQPNPQIIGDDMIAYRHTGTRLLISKIEGCPSLAGDPIIITEVYGGQTCSNDRFRTVSRGGGAIPSAYCRFGMFTPYDKPAD